MLLYGRSRRVIQVNYNPIHREEFSTYIDRKVLPTKDFEEAVHKSDDRDGDCTDGQQ